MYSNYGGNPFTSVPRRNLSRRNARGAGWHKKGYRDMGCMWINVRRGSYGHTRGMDVNEDETLRGLWNHVVNSVKMEDGFPLPEGWTFELTSNRQVVSPTDDPVTTMFDGGENIYVKVYDEEDQERVFNFGSHSWEYHVPGRRY